MSAGLTDNHGEFGLAVDLLAQRGVIEDRIVGADDAVARLDEEFRFLAADRRIGLFGIVRAIVAAAAQDGAGHHRRCQFDVAQLQIGFRIALRNDFIKRLAGRRAGADETNRIGEPGAFLIGCRAQRIDDRFVPQHAETRHTIDDEIDDTHEISSHSVL